MTGPDLFSLGLVAAGGMIGGTARLAVSRYVDHRLGEALPWGTFIVNVTGCAAIGAFAATTIDDAYSVVISTAWLFFVVGILGSYTTVSAFSLQTLTLFRVGLRMRAVLYILASVALCVLAATAAFAAMRSVLA